MWASPYVKRVELALKLNGIPYEYVEEDLKNKSPSLLKLNLVHQKVPVLVHNGKPIVESLVILEYIDETWKTGLLPQDPYKRSLVHLWAGFMQHVFESMVSVLKTSGQAQEKAIKEVSEKLNLLEEGLKGFYPNGFPKSFDPKNVGLLEVVILAHLRVYEAREEVIGFKVIDLQITPLIYSCIRAMTEIPEVKEVSNPHEKVVAFLKFFRNKAIKSSD
ncbi:glutathione S-transferase U9-like [Malus sylvestris]|uniref:glutathione S-transferase U9-like n=1 Tax=Malus sylvestris TaxID=3752 RepID=UPI0021ACFC2E|nr:glutathione S-transferase U9-like [Malus sylvestris]